MPFLVALLQVLHIVITAYTWIIIAAALISWVNPDPYNKIVQILYKLTEPVYDFIRRFIRTNFGGIDIAPVIVLLTLMIIDRTFINLVFGF